MEKNFIINNGANEVIVEHEMYDLHNVYDFSGVLLEPKDQYLQLSFSPILEFGRGKIPLSIIFRKITFLEFSSGFGTRKFSGLDEVGYKSPEDTDYDWLMNEEQSCENDHLFFRMDGDEYIRVYAEYADLIHE